METLNRIFDYIVEIIFRPRWFAVFSLTEPPRVALIPTRFGSHDLTDVPKMGPYDSETEARQVAGLD